MENIDVYVNTYYTWDCSECNCENTDEDTIEDNSEITCCECGKTFKVSLIE